MTELTLFFGILGFFVGLIFIALLLNFRKRKDIKNVLLDMKNKPEKWGIEPKKFNTLKSEGDDQPKKEEELIKEEVLDTPASSPFIRVPGPPPTDPTLTPILPVEEEK